MRTLLISIAALLCAVNAWACNCFSPEMKAKTARDTLELARLAVYGQVSETRPDGSALLLVLEVFKGAEKGSIIVIEPGEGNCAPRRPKVNDTLLLLGFESPPTACGAYEPEHFLLEEFRRPKFR